MSSLKLTPDAAEDFEEITKYTLATWGRQQAARYADQLIHCFTELANGDVTTTVPIPDRRDIRSHRCQHHYVFSLHDHDGPIAVVAVFHESMDTMARLRDRLEA